MLLATLMSAPVISSLRTLPPSEDVGKWLHEYLEKNLKPLAFPRLVRAQVNLLLLALRHMLAIQRRKRRRSLRSSPIFADALKLLEIHCMATNKHWSSLHHWQSPLVKPRYRRRKTKRMSSMRVKSN